MPAKGLNSLYGRPRYRASGESTGNGPFSESGHQAAPEHAGAQPPTAEERLARLEVRQHTLAVCLRRHAETVQSLSDQIAAIDKRLESLEKLHALPPGELDLYDAYQLIVNELGDMKKVVLALQREARIEGETPPSSLQSLNPVRH